MVNGQWFYCFLKNSPERFIHIGMRSNQLSSTLFTPIDTPPRHGFWTLQQHLLASKIVDYAFLSWCAGSHWVPRQCCTADDPSIRRFGRSKRSCIELKCESLHCHGAQWPVFSWSFFEILRRQEEELLPQTSFVGWRPGAHAITNVCWWNKYARMPLSQCMSHDDLALSVHALDQCSLAQLFLHHLPDCRLQASVGHFWIH